MLFNQIQPGKWVNLVTDLCIGIDDNKVEDIVKSPVFILTREETGFNLTAMVVDQNLSLLTWYLDHGSRFGKIAGHTPIQHQSFYASIVKFSFENIELTSNTQLILETACQQRDKFLIKHPEMKNVFFKIENENAEKKPLEKIDDRTLCPITLEPFKDPVTAPDGRNYERAAIVDWLEAHGTSPITMEPMKVEQLITNYGLRL